MPAYQGFVLIDAAVTRDEFSVAGPSCNEFIDSLYEDVHGETLGERTKFDSSKSKESLGGHRVDRG